MLRKDAEAARLEAHRTYFRGPLNFPIWRWEV